MEPVANISAATRSLCIEPHSSLWASHPPVGFFIAIAGVLGIFVPLYRDWGKIGRQEKSIWTLLMFILLGLELRTLHLDRIEHDDSQAFARCQQLESFGRIADRMDRSIRESESQFQITTSGIDGVLLKTQEAAQAAREGIEGMVGKDSYLVVSPQHSFPVTAQTDGTFFLMVSKLGKHIVWDGAVGMGEGPIDSDFYSRPQESFRLAPIADSNVAALGKTIQPAKGRETWYGFTLSSRGTAGGENLGVRFNDKKQEWEFRYFVYASKPSNRLTPPILLKSLPWTKIPTPVLVESKR